jgi:hypothetical protein
MSGAASIQGMSVVDKLDRLIELREWGTFSRRGVYVGSRCPEGRWTVMSWVAEATVMEC